MIKLLMDALILSCHLCQRFDSNVRGFLLDIELNIRVYVGLLLLATSIIIIEFEFESPSSIHFAFALWFHHVAKWANVKLNCRTLIMRSFRILASFPKSDFFQDLSTIFQATGYDFHTSSNLMNLHSGQETIIDSSSMNDG
ncbi:hypothetical protein M5K25_011036 [Dendrobium thyrsiflorum]|uniref:Uncharacterized protein n=1 Tax=Dendrobium thyrsiflorum TaxID=117978 RepID=A0ABD0V2D0_DENTH